MFTSTKKGMSVDQISFIAKWDKNKTRSFTLCLIIYFFMIAPVAFCLFGFSEAFAVGGISNSKVVVPSAETVEKGRFEIEPSFGLTALDDADDAAQFEAGGRLTLGVLDSLEIGANVTFLTVEDSDVIDSESNLIEDDEEWLPDRPDVAESAFVVPIGRFQVETGINVGEARGEEDVSVITPFLFRYGFYKDFELRVGGPGLIRDEGEENFGDVDLGVKYHLLDESGWIPAIGLIPQVTLPAASNDAGSDSVDPRFFSTFDKDLPLDFTIEWNLGVGYIDKPEDSGRFFQLLYAASLSRPLVKPFIIFAEVYGVSKVEPGEGGSVNTDFGLIFRLSKKCCHGLGRRFWNYQCGTEKCIYRLIL
jgi:hypothetical protein